MTNKDFILTKTPHRVSFFGGGSDLKSFYNEHGGITFSTAISNYVYVGVKRHTKFFDERYRIVYSETELKKEIPKIKNDIVRETLKFCNFNEPIYINSISDLPASSGLGSSSAFTVGLLKAIYSLMNVKKNNAQLAEDACEIEINRINKPIGKQDQYACSLGGVNLIKYHSSDLVTVKKNLNARNFINKIMSNSLLIWTGVARKSEIILKKQNLDMQKGSIESEMLKIKEICENVYKEICNYNGKNFNHLNNLFIEGLNDSWNIKKSLNKNMTNLKINKIMQIINFHCKGKVGIKLLGAGAGGFILVTGLEDIKKLKKQFLKKKILSLTVKNDIKGSSFIND